MYKMSLSLLIKDEFKGFYKSKVMVVLWIGMPLISLFLHYLQPDTEGIPISIFVGLMVSSLSGTLASVMISTTIVSEKDRHVYDLFLIRPVKRWNLMFAKLIAVYLCIMIATLLSVLIGIILDLIKTDIPIETLLDGVWDSLTISLSAMAISCSISILIGILVNSTMLAVILAIYLGNQLSLIAVLPGIFFESINTIAYALIIGLILTFLVNLVTVLVLQRKSL